VAQEAIYATDISAGNVLNGNVLTTNFQNFPNGAQTSVLPGFWSVDGYRSPNGSQPAGAFQSTGDGGTSLPTFSPSNSAWNYTMGQDNGAMYGFLQTTRGARLRYTPVAGAYGDMTLILKVAPEKTVGQGFGSAQQFMDVGINFDTTSLSGYAVRIERIGAFSNATVVNLVKYDNGVVTKLTDTGGYSMAEASTGFSGYRTMCTIEIKTAGNKLTARVSSDSDSLDEHLAIGLINDTNDYPAGRKLEATITPSTAGGVWIYHTGTNSGGNRTLLQDLNVQWN
jgi:hypothetical protein